VRSSCRPPSACPILVSASPAGRLSAGDGAIKVGRMLEHYNTFHFEEPIPFTDVDGMAQSAAALDIPLAAGEQQHTRYDFKELLVRGAADIVQPDVTKCGGLSEGKKIAALADAFGKYVTTSVGLAAHLHYWASTPPAARP